MARRDIRATPETAGCDGLLNMMGSSTSLTACSTGASMIANTLQNSRAIWPWLSRYEWQTIDLNQYPNGSAGTLPSPNAQQRKRAARYQFD
jgi:hypothetical protein